MLVCSGSERRTGIVPRSISTMKLRREPSANSSPNTMSGTMAASRTTPWSDSFACKENGFVAGSGRGAAAIISSAVISVTSLRVSHRALHADLEIDDLDLVLDKGPARFAVLAAPFRIAECGPIPFLEKSYPAIGEGIDHRRRAEGRIVVELGARPVDVAGMEEAHQPVVGAVERAADQRRDVRRADQPMPRDDAHDLDIIFRKAERRWRCGTAEPRPAHRLLNRNGLHMPELYQALGRGRPRQGGVVRDTSGPFGADRDSSDDARDAAALLSSTRIPARITGR